MKLNRRGMAFLMALGMVAISAVMIASLAMLISSYVSTTRSSKQKEYSLHYANMALDEIKWHIQKGYKRWLYEATHSPGSDGIYDYETRAHSNDDTILTSSANPDSGVEGGYIYSAIPVDDIGNTYWIKVVDHLIWPDGKIREDYYTVASTSGLKPSGRIEGWIRISDRDDTISQYNFVYDIFCKGTDLRGVKINMDGSKVVIVDDHPPKVSYIRATARGSDSISVSEFSVGVFKGHINVGKGYNVFGKLHAYEYIDFVFTPQRYEMDVAKIYDQFSVSNKGTGFYLHGSRLASSIEAQKTYLDNHKNDVIKLQGDNSEIRTWGFHSNRKAWASFVGDNAHPEITPPISPKTNEHFSMVRREAHANGIHVESGDVRFLYLDPGELNVNGDGKVKITLSSGEIFVNGVSKGSGAGTSVTVNIADLRSPLMYVDGNPSTGIFYNATVGSCSALNITSGIYMTRGVRGLTGVLDGQFSLFCDYDVVLSGDILYQEFVGSIPFLYKDLLDSGKIKKPYSGAGAQPDLDKPNILGVFTKHDIIIPADMFNQPYSIRPWGAYSWRLRYDRWNPYKGDWSGEPARRVDGEGTGVLTGTVSGGGDIFPDIFSMGVFYANHRVYGEIPSGSSSGEYYNRNKSYYCQQKGTWFLYGSVTCDEQVFAVLSNIGQQTWWEGFKYRSYNYDPNLYAYEPPFSLRVEVQPIWSWRVTTTYPAGLTEY